MGYKIVCLCCVAQGDRKERGGPSGIQRFFAGNSLFVQKICASVFTPVGLRVFAVINCNLECVKDVYIHKNNLKINVNVDVALYYSENPATSPNHFSLP